MAKRKVTVQSRPARRPASRAARASSASGTATPGSRARTKSAAARPARQASRCAPGKGKKKRAQARPATPAPAPRQERAETTGRGAAQPGGRRTVELFSHVREEDGTAPTLPSSLDFEQRPSAARSGRAELEERYREHPETDPGLTAGDVDADWPAAYSVGDEAPGGDNPTPGQAVVEEVGRALGVEYGEEEELEASDRIASRDRHRWELNPASSEDYPERTKGGPRKKRQAE